MVTEKLYKIRVYSIMVEDFSKKLRDACYKENMKEVLRWLRAIKTLCLKIEKLTLSLI